MAEVCALLSAVLSVDRCRRVQNVKTATFDGSGARQRRRSLFGGARRARSDDFHVLHQRQHVDVLDERSAGLEVVRPDVAPARAVVDAQRRHRVTAPVEEQRQLGVVDHAVFRASHPAATRMPAASLRHL